MQIYNSLSGQKEELVKTAKKLKLFVCGPTVYSNSHIGHARAYVAFDVIVRCLRSRGYKIFYLQNITNVDDKIIARAKSENKNPFTIADFYEKEYHASFKKLNVSSVNKYARASDYIKEITKQVKVLIKKGFAYEIKGNGWYFDISKFKDYGKLSKRKVMEAEDAISRIDENINKRNKGDFCLWKFVKIDKKLETGDWQLTIENGEPSWTTPLGRGRPGWHIEDTAISESFFGPQYYIHGGGIDLKFPHHEAEIAQQEASSGKIPFVKIWMHVGHLLMNGQKMSKSLKNFVTIQEFINKFQDVKNASDVLRLMIISHHYRSGMDYNEKLSDNSENSLKTVRQFLAKLKFVSARSKHKNDSKMFSLVSDMENKFNNAMADDFNTPLALSSIFSLINDINKEIWHLSKKDALLIEKSVTLIFKSLGFYLVFPKIPEKIKKMAEKRELLRINKQFVQSDVLRKKIKALGFEVEDTPLGPYAREN